MQSRPLHPASGSRKVFLVVSLVFVLFGSLLLPQGAGSGRSAGEVRVTVLHTTDIHGRVLPWDYYRQKDADVGLARLAAYVKRVRREQPRVLLLDGGDLIQGTPLAWYYQRKDLSKPNPLIAVFNAMHYDAFTVGNHEYNYGLDTLLSCRSQARFPFLSANTRQGKSLEPFFTPYIVKEFDGVKIGVLGLTTSNIPTWESAENLRGLVFDQTPETARKWVKVLREKEKVDAVVVCTHEGIEMDLETNTLQDANTENRAWAIATAVPGVDVVLTGHAHANVPPRPAGSALISQGSCWGQVVTRIELAFHKERGKWVLDSKSGVNVPMTKDIAPDPEIVSLIEPYDKVVREWVQSPVVELESDFSAEGVFTSDNALLDLVHNCALSASGAKLSFASYLPGSLLRFRQGPLRVADVFALYPFENTLAVLSIKGKYIREALETSCEIYGPLDWDAEKGVPQIHQEPNFRRYSFNTLAGARYAVDPTRPRGSRVLFLEVDGRPMDPEKEYTLVTNNYQAAGGGGRYAMLKNGTVVSQDSREFRDILIEYLQKKGSIKPDVDWNWFLLTPLRFVFPERNR